MSFQKRRRMLVKNLGGKVLWKFEQYIAKNSLIGDSTFFDAREFPWSSELEANWKTIRRELDEVLTYREKLPSFQDISKDQVVITNDEHWKTFFLYGMGYQSEPNCARCPETAKLVERIPGMTTAFFSILSPHKHIPPHRGVFKGFVRYHLGLKIPDPPNQCRIRVGQDYGQWEEGKSMFFDDTFEHEVWNDSDDFRVVLFVDFMRPLRFPAAMVNRALISTVRHSGFVQDSRKNMASWEQAFVRKKESAAEPVH
ncbi:MAG: aspartyl/asparaginyl beta-hydroxylase domain-containing protein [Bacteroidetes bacterium]|nr:aspartyl/asparaginyl beta-hydroxylase domain-containing protein [Bacteroidota bacterium]